MGDRRRCARPGRTAASVSMSIRRDLFAGGVLAVAPMLPGVAPFGVVAGLSAVDQGLSALQAMAMSATIFAGASQLVALQLMGEGALPAVVMLTALTVNLRFAMYSASLAPHLQHLGRRWQLPLAYFLVDQNYTVSIHRFRYGEPDWRARGHWYLLGGGVALWLTWQVSTAVGVFVGSGVPPEWGLDFAIPLVFMVLLVPALRTRPHMVATLTGGGVATAAADMVLHLGIVVGALAGIMAGVIAARASRAR